MISLLGGSSTQPCVSCPPPASRANIEIVRRPGSRVAGGTAARHRGSHDRHSMTYALRSALRTPTEPMRTVKCGTMLVLAERYNGLSMRAISAN
jgi:hypothetical protein